MKTEIIANDKRAEIESEKGGEDCPVIQTKKNSSYKNSSMGIKEKVKK